MPKTNVLIFPCGSVNALEIQTALKDVMSVNTFGGTSRIDHGEYVYKNYITDIPFINDPQFIPEFNRILEEHQIDVVFPTHDTAAVYLAEHADEIKAKLAVAGFKQADICRYKDKTYQLFKDDSFCPIIYRSAEEIRNYPVFVKPVLGEGSRNVRKIESAAEFIDQDWSNDFLVVEYLPGEELTVDCFTDRHGVLRFVGPRKRNRVSNGISVNSYTVELEPEVK